MIDIINGEMDYKEDTTFYIYIHICPNAWSYIGMSERPKQRWNNGEGYKDNKAFYDAIQKFGWENIKHEIVATTNYRWIARKIERTLITHFKKKNRCYNENNIEKILLEKKSIRKKPLKKVGQYDKKGNLVKIYNSAAEASKELMISSDRIQSCCRGRNKTSCGYIWKYV